MWAPTTVWSIGHSIQPFEDFVRLLAAHGIERVADVRTVPKSRRHPHFHTDALAETLDILRPKGERDKNKPAAVLLLSDGRTTSGVSPVEQARRARELNVPIYTVSLGTDGGTVPGGSGGPLPVPPDPDTMRRIADISKGRFYQVDDAGRLVPLTAALGTGGSLTSRKRFTGHLTCSAIVVDPVGRALPLRHNPLTTWLRPGGHLTVFEPDWASLGFGARDPDDRAVARAVVAVRRADVGSRLDRLVTTHGLRIVDRVTEQSFAYGIPAHPLRLERALERAVGDGRLDRAVAARWWARQQALDAAGRFRATWAKVLVVAHRP